MVDKNIQSLLDKGIIERIDAPSFDLPVYLFPIDFVLNNFESSDSTDYSGDCECCRCEYGDLVQYCYCDCECPVALADVLDNKSCDEDYAFAYDFLGWDGFRLPLALISHETGTLRQYNGHHRLAAARDLGYERVPYVVESEELSRKDTIAQRCEYYGKIWSYTEDINEYGKHILVSPPWTEE